MNTTNQVNNQTGLSKAREKIQEKRGAGIAAERLNPVEKAARNPVSLRRAINAKCWDCVGRDHDPGGKLRVKHCEIRKCSLWPVRPWQDGSDQPDIRPSSEPAQESNLNEV